jgi:hypothetical protein
MPWLQTLRELLHRHGALTALWLRWTGLVLLLLAGVFTARSWRCTHGLLRATATVTENVATFAPHGGVQYLPRLRFRLPNGQITLALASRASAEIEFPATETVPILYPPGHPENSLIATVWQLYSTAITLAVLGILILDLGLILQRIRV